MFLVKNFPVGQRVLVDSSSGQSATQGEGKKEEVTRQGDIPLVKEVALVSLGNNQSKPYLLVGFCMCCVHCPVQEMFLKETKINGVVLVCRSTWSRSF